MRIFQESDFEIPELSGQSVFEVLITFEETDVVQLFLNIEGEWHCCFLDAAIGFWETGYGPEQDNYPVIDASEYFGFELPGILSRVRCVESQIYVCLEGSGLLTLSFVSDDPYTDDTRLMYTKTGYSASFQGDDKGSAHVS